MKYSFTGSSLAFGSQVSNNRLTAGAGGKGGDSGTDGLINIDGGAGGAGGIAEGGGVYVVATGPSVNNSTIASATLDSNLVTAGMGGRGGEGGNRTSPNPPGVHGKGSAGGAGGLAAGGGIYSNSTNGGATKSTLTMTGDTLAGNVVTGGTGGNAGTGNTGNGGNGGDGGAGGSAEGGGLFNGDNTTLSVTNSTIGGRSLSTVTPDEFRNILVAGNGGAGGNGGTGDNTQIQHSAGGDGGAGGSVLGGGVYVNSGSAKFRNDTIVYNVANLILTALTGGAGGAHGDAAGDGTGRNGVNGTPGSANGGGYFSPTPLAPGASNTVGNTIIALNAAGSNLSNPGNPPVSTSPDVSGAFASQGHNLIGVVTTGTGGATGFTMLGDQTGTLASPLDPVVGPLRNNGGPTPTDGLLAGSTLAIDKGDNNLVTSPPFTLDPSSTSNPQIDDQRGPGFPRIDSVNNIVDIGAYELQPPVIQTLTPNTATEGSPDTDMIITGTGFTPGATVNFNGTVLTPAPSDISQSQIKVTIPAALLNPSPDLSSVNVFVSVPDASGTGTTIPSNALPFSIPEPATPPVTNPGDQTSDEGVMVNLQITSPDADVTMFSDGGTLPPGLMIDPSGLIHGTIDPRGALASPGYTVTISALDEGVSGSTTFHWVVNDITPPTLTPPAGAPLTSHEGDVITPASGITVTVVDADMGTITDVDAVTGKHTLPPTLTIDPTSGVITGTIDPNGFGKYTVKISTTDNGHSATTTFVWNVIGSPPTFTQPPDRSNNEGEVITQSSNIKVTATNVDPNTYTDVDPVTGKHTLPPSLVINATTGVITGPIGARAEGVYTVKISASHHGAVATTSFMWTVIDFTAPTLTGPGNQTNNVGDMLTTASNIKVTAVDADPGTPGTFTDLVSGVHTLPSGLSIDPTSGVITGTITGNSKIYSVTITATDNAHPGATTFTWTVNPQGTTTSPKKTVVLGTDGSLVEFVSLGAAQPILLSGAGTIKAISTVLATNGNTNGNTDVYAITTGKVGAQYDNTLWAYIDGGWSQRSTGKFQQISAATDRSGSPVVFGLVTDGTLWEQTPKSPILNANWHELAFPGFGPGSVQYISAVTDAAGNDIVYAVSSTPGFVGTLWEHNPSFGGSQWLEISSGSFRQVSAGLNSTQQAVVYGVLTNNQLWEQNPIWGVGLNKGFVQLNAPGSGLPSSFLSVQAGGPDTVFGIASADNTIWEHAGANPNAGNTHLSSTIQAAQLSATRTPSGDDQVFATLVDASFYEYSALLNHFRLLRLDVYASSTPQ